MSDYINFFLNSSSSVIQYECVEISHPNFSKVYRIVRNNSEGLEVTLETAEVVTFDYYPLKLTPAETSDNLDFSINVEFGDVGEVIPTEIERVVLYDGFATKPIFKYRSYRSDNLLLPMFGPLVLEIQEMTTNREGTVFEARAPKANLNATGLKYSIDKFPSLRFFV